MNIKQLEEFLQVPGRYQVYSDGAGDFTALPIMEGGVLITPNSEQQMGAQIEDLTYNNSTG